MSLILYDPDMQGLHQFLFQVLGRHSWLHTELHCGLLSQRFWKQSKQHPVQTVGLIWSKISGPSQL